MARGSWLLIHILSSILVIAPLVIALVTKEWYVVMSLTNSFRLGLGTDCNEWGCKEFGYQKLADYSAGVCDRAVGNVESRIKASKGLLILALVLTILQCFYSIAMWAINRFTLVASGVHVLIAALSFFFSTVVVLVYGVTVDSWLFCGTTYCDFIESEGQECVNYVGYSYVALCCGSCILFVAFLSLLVSLVLTTDHEVLSTTVTIVEQLDEYGYEEDHKGGNMTAAGDGGKGAATSSNYAAYNAYEAYNADSPMDADGGADAYGAYDPYAHHDEGAAEADPSSAAYPPTLPEELQDGDWAYEADNGYFWSEERQMYFEPQSQRFYDPAIDAWYDGETGEWVPNAEMAAQQQ